MMYLHLERATKTYGEKVLYKDVDIQINKGQKVALVARNGSGKSTLLRVLAGIEQTEGVHSKRLVRKDIRIGYLEQDPDFDPRISVLDAVMSANSPLTRAIREYEEALLFPEQKERLEKAMLHMDEQKAWAEEARIKEILFRFRIPDLNQEVGKLSGGQKKRVALARMIVENPDVWILDEPTNHLDVDMIEWLENYLLAPNLTLFLVTHDRYILETVCDEILELDQGKIFRYTGNYSDYLEKKAIREETEASSYDRTRKLMLKELDWIRRQPKARGTKAKSRVQGFDAIQKVVNDYVEADSLQIDMKASRLGSKIVEAQYISKSFDGKPVISDFHYNFKKGDRVGVVGPNGCGKSTFLKLITEEMKPDTGKVVVGETVVFGYYSQEGLSYNEDKRVIDIITDIAEYIPLEKGGKLTAAQLLERFLFPRPQQQVLVSQLSGGEKRRLYLLTVLMKNPNFLILDEPTNDLDIMTLGILEDYLAGFPGCLLIVSHDRYFLDRLVDHMFVFAGEGRIKDFNGNFSAYRQQFPASGPGASPKSEDQEKKDRKLAYEQADQMRKEIKRLEKEMEKLEERKRQINLRFEDTSISQDEIIRLSQELNQIQEKLSASETRWLELSELAG